MHTYYRMIILLSPKEHVPLRKFMELPFLTLLNEQVTKSNKRCDKIEDEML